jgi:hypothetical protein
MSGKRPPPMWVRRRRLERSMRNRKAIKAEYDVHNIAVTAHQVSVNACLEQYRALTMLGLHESAEMFRQQAHDALDRQIDATDQTGRLFRELMFSQE